jgi:acyl-CoA thioesterase FadM
LTQLARITVRRRIEWIDTDAAGIYHWTTVFRLAEAAEAALHTALAIEQVTFGFTPRVATSFDYRSPLRFNDCVEVRFAVESVGRTSVRDAINVDGPRGRAAAGHATACLIDTNGRPQP